MSDETEDADVQAAEEDGAETPETAEDVAVRPSQHADSPEEVARFIRPELLARYEVHSYRQAAAILTTSFPALWAEIEAALLAFSITVEDIGIPGGNESRVPKKFTELMRPNGWHETRIQGDLLVRIREHHAAGNGGLTVRDSVIENFIDGHKIDYVKGQVAVDFEWNSKDQTFDRDLYAFRTFHDCAVIGAGVMVTRSGDLNPFFNRIALLTKEGIVKGGPDKWTPVRKKYGASTTWMGKLLYRMNAGRHGSCPVLVVGIKPNIVSDLEKLNDPQYPFATV